MAKPELRYIGLSTGLADGQSPRLQVATPAGLVRDVPLNRRELVQIIRCAASALERLDNQEGR